MPPSSRSRPKTAKNFLNFAKILTCGRPFLGDLAKPPRAAQRRGPRLRMASFPVRPPRIRPARLPRVPHGLRAAAAAAPASTAPPFQAPRPSGSPSGTGPQSVPPHQSSLPSQPAHPRRCRSASTWRCRRSRRGSLRWSARWRAPTMDEGLQRAALCTEALRGTRRYHSKTPTAALNVCIPYGDVFISVHIARYRYVYTHGIQYEYHIDIL